MLNTKDRLAELDVLLDYIDIEDWLKIPENIIIGIKQNKNKNYNWEYDQSIPFEKQEINNDTLMLFLLIMYKYVANEEEKKEIDKILESNTNEYNKKYDMNNIFKESSQRQDANVESEKENIHDNVETSLVKPQENIFMKIKNYIIKFFNRNKN